MGSNADKMLSAALSTLDCVDTNMHIPALRHLSTCLQERRQALESLKQLNERISWMMKSDSRAVDMELLAKLQYEALCK